MSNLLSALLLLPNSVGNGWLVERPWRLNWPMGLEVEDTVAERERGCCGDTWTPCGDLEGGVQASGGARLFEGFGCALSGPV